MEVKINVINEMKKIRNSTYTDTYTWVDELIQNSQRANAKHIKVTIGSDEIIVEDDGIGCTDPQVLFEKNISSWDDNVMETENPFGEGFFSTLVAADKVTVESVGFKAVFDIKKMFETNDVDVVEVTPNKKKSGFKITLSDLRYNITPYSTSTRFRDTAKYIKSPRTTINGDLVHYEGLSPKTSSPFLRKIDNEFFKGWIMPVSWYYGSGIQCFAFGRKVKNIDSIYGIRGVINLKPNAVTLRSPDRHDFIQDEKYDNFADVLNEEIKKLMVKIIQKGSSDDITDHQDNINRYVSRSEFSKYVRFELFSTKNTLKTAMSEESEDTNEPMNNSYESDTDNNQNNELITLNPTVTAGNFKKHDDVHALTPASSPKNVNTNKRNENGFLIEDVKMGFYVDKDKVDLFTDEIELAEYYNIPVVLIRNKVELNCINGYDAFENISSISDHFSLKSDFTNIMPMNESENRIYRVLNTVSDILFNDDSMFVIADNNSEKIININGHEESVEKITTVATAYDSKIYINRACLKEHKPLTEDSNTFTENDKEFVLLHLETIAHEMSHVVYGTTDNTKTHFMKIIELMQKIIGIMYSHAYISHSEESISA